MNFTPTAEGVLRIDAETAADWKLLRSILVDANGCEIDLASRLGGIISEEAGAEDWQEYIVPDLREEFRSELAQVRAELDAAATHAAGGAGAITIGPDNGFVWYSALNQARLALEERYHFGQTEHIAPGSLAPDARFPFFRSQLYCELQSLLLEFVLQ